MVRGWDICQVLSSTDSAIYFTPDKTTPRQKCVKLILKHCAKCGPSKQRRKLVVFRTQFNEVDTSADSMHLQKILLKDSILREVRTILCQQCRNVNVNVKEKAVAVSVAVSRSSIAVCCVTEDNINICKLLLYGSPRRGHQQMWQTASVTTPSAQQQPGTSQAVKS